MPNPSTPVPRPPRAEVPSPSRAPFAMLAAADPAHQAELDADIRAALDFQDRALADSTRAAYRADWRAFEAYCERYGFCPLPAEPEVVAVFLAHEARLAAVDTPSGHGDEPPRSVSTLERRLAAIRLAHRVKQLDPPTGHETVRLVLRGIRRTRGVRPNKKTAILAEQIRAMAALADTDTLIGLRDRALLLVGFAGALRRSELVAIEVEHLSFTADGLELFIPRSKTDPEGEGYRLPIKAGQTLCPVAALRHWLRAATITTGPVFRRGRRGGGVAPEALSDRGVALIVKRYAQKLGLDPAQFAGHSLRSGFLTSAARNGASLDKMMAVSRHKEPRTLVEYIQDAEKFDRHASDGLY